ncbi:MAG: serine protease [Clostridia bacterium]|nr:serine protease [Clostridia bacterium]
MNKTLKKIITGVTCFTLCGCIGLFTACNDKAVTAYEIAVKYGFEGTEEEWLATLKGETGATGKDGKSLDIWEMYEQSEYSGTFIEFLRELGFSFDLQEDNDTVTIANNVSSVVSICCGYQKATRRLVSGGMWGSHYEDATYVSAAEGSGVIWSLEDNGETASAYIVTNYHVVYQNASYNDNESGISDYIYVYPYGAREGFSTGDEDGDGYLDEDGKMGDFTGDGIKAKYVGGAMDYDIAVLRVENSEYLHKSAVSEVRLGVSNDVLLGEKAYVIGNSNGYGISVTGGLISTLSENIYITSFDGLKRTMSFRVMRTDAAINGGNSGGALFNAQGRLIGIPNAKTTADGVDNMGYALPIDRVKAVVENVLNNATASKKGYVSLATLGIVTTLQSSTSYLDENGNIRVKEEFRVTEVKEGMLASASTEENKCFKFGDVILSGTLNGNTVDYEQRYLFQEQMLDVRKGDTITFKVNREGTIISVEMTFDKDEYFTVYA